MSQPPPNYPQGQGRQYAPQSYGQQPMHQAPQPMYGQQAPQPMYGQQAPQPMYGQQAPQPMYGQQQPMYAPQQAPVAYAPQMHQQHQEFGQAHVTVNKEPAPPVNVGARFNYAEGEYRDVIWLALFVVHLIGMGITAGVYGKALVDHIDKNTGDSSVDLDVWKVTGIMFAVALTGGVMGFLWLKVMQRYRDSIVTMSFKFTIAFLILAGIILMAIIYLLFAAIMGCMYKFYQSRIPMATATLAAAVDAVSAHPGTVYAQILAVFLSIVWQCCWTFTFAAIVYDAMMDADEKNANIDPNDPNAEEASVEVNRIAMFFLLISLYWTGEVIKNIAHVTAAGTVASWWLLPNQEINTRSAFKRAVTTSLGSICLGSLIIAIIKAVRETAREAERNARNQNNQGAAFALCCLQCLLGMIERLMEIFNLYAFTQVAIYGKDFKTAAKDTWALLKSQGFDVLINDDLTGMVIFMGALVGASVCGLFGSLYAVTLDFDGWIVFGIISFVIGLIVCSTMLSAVVSGVCTTYVLWAEDPAAMVAGRPAHFQALSTAASGQHPQAQYWR